MLHVTKNALCASTRIERKGDEDEAGDIVTKALEDLTKSVDDRLKAIEGKSDASAKLEERLKALETKANRPGAGGEKTPDEQAAAEKKAFGTYLRYGAGSPAEELKTLTVSSDPAGGYLAPVEMSSEFIRDLVLVSPMRSVASVRSTTSPSVVYPKRIGITNAKWKGEGQPQEASEPAFGQAEIPVREINTYVPISNQLLADSGGQAEAEVRIALADDFGQKEAVAFVKGNGVLEPEGVLTNTDIKTIASGVAGDVGFDALIALMYDLPAQYRAQGRWMMNGQTLARLRKIKDAGNNYIWQPALTESTPETILGRPVVEAPDFPDVANNATPILFGDFSGYRIIDRVGLSILVNPYKYAELGLTLIHATRRVGGGVLQASKFRKLKAAAN